MPSERRPDPPAGPTRVLIVEDQAVSRAILRANLERAAAACGLRVEVEQADSVASAKAALGGPAPFAVVLLDLELMEGGRGEDVLVAARSLPSPPRVVVLSGLQPGWDDSRLAGLAILGPDAALTKPTSPAAVARAVFGEVEPWVSAS